MTTGNVTVKTAVTDNYPDDVLWIRTITGKVVAHSSTIANNCLIFLKVATGERWSGTCGVLHSSTIISFIVGKITVFYCGITVVVNGSAGMTSPIVNKTTVTDYGGAASFCEHSSTAAGRVGIIPAGQGKAVNQGVTPYIAVNGYNSLAVITDILKITDMTTEQSGVFCGISLRKNTAPGGKSAVKINIVFHGETCGAVILNKSAAFIREIGPLGNSNLITEPCNRQGILQLVKSIVPVETDISAIG